MRNCLKVKKPARSDVYARRSSLKTRRLVCESLESRQLMAADLLDHNFVLPEDANSSGYVSPLDALVVINAINAINADSDNTKLSAAIDVDADGTLTPLDALFVVNFLNRTIESGIEVVSSVDAERRILRIEQAIAAQALPPSMQLGTAQHWLAVLRAGGHPEVGDRMLNGQLTNDLGMTDGDLLNEVEIAKYVSEYRMGLGSTSMDAQQLTMFADTLKSRLEAIGVSSEMSLELFGDIQSSEGLSMQLIMDKVKARLVEFNIDVASALPERMDVLFNSIIDRLQASGFNEEEISAITNDLRTVYESGIPITIELLDDTVTSIHVDESEFYPSEEDIIVRDLAEKLRQAGFTDAIISTISTEFRIAYPSGQPLAIDQLMAKLINLRQG